MLRGYKTVIFAVLLGAVTALSNVEMQIFITQHIQWLGPFVGVLVVGLRALTVSPIFKKD